MKPQIVDIDALVAELPIRVLGGEHLVKPVNAIATKLADSITDENRVDVMIQIVAMVVPTLTVEQLGTLTVTQLDAILQVSARGVTAVRDSDPNVDGPTTLTASPA